MEYSIGVRASDKCYIVELDGSLCEYHAETKSKQCKDTKMFLILSRVCLHLGILEMQLFLGIASC